MDFLDSLKNIKKEMRVDSYKIAKKSNKNSDNKDKLKTQEINLDKETQEIFLKQEKLQDEFLEFIKNSDIKKF